MRRKWSKENIAAAIIAARLAGAHLSYTSVYNNDRALLQAAVRYFGAWEAAVTAAGYDYDSYRRHQKHIPYDDISKYRVRYNKKRPKSLFNQFLSSV